jgi:hypothetical protein
MCHGTALPYVPTVLPRAHCLGFVASNQKGTQTQLPGQYGLQNFLASLTETLAHIYLWRQ